MTEEPIKVVHVMPQIGIGGAETQLHALITRSEGESVVHRVLYYDDARDAAGHQLYAADRLCLERVPRVKARPLRFVRDLAKAIRRHKPDIVHCWLYSGAVWGRLGGMLAGAPHIIIAHRAVHLVRVPVLRMIERLTAHRVHFLANSAACARLVAQQIGIQPDRFRVVYNGIDLPRWQRHAAIESVRSELGIEERVKLVVMVGRLTPAKNYPMLLRVAQRTKQKLPVHFIVLGHGELERELRQLANRLGVTDSVTFAGLRRDVVRFLQSADLFCYTSRFEGFPNALLEAMAAKLPIITTDFSSARELITSGESGLVVPVDDDHAMTEAIRSYLDEPELAARHAAIAHATAQHRFSMERMVSETVCYYRDIMQGASRRGERAEL